MPKLHGVKVNETSVQHSSRSVAKTGLGQLCTDSLFSSLQIGNDPEEAPRIRTSNRQLLSSSLRLQSQMLFDSSSVLQRAECNFSSSTTSVMNFPYFAGPIAILRGKVESSNKMAGLDALGAVRAGNSNIDVSVDMINASNSCPVTLSSNPGKETVPCLQIDVPWQRLGLNLVGSKSFNEKVWFLWEEMRLFFYRLL